MQPSADQAKVIDTLKHSNVIVEANPGSGKTTTACHVARAFPEWKTCLLTYSSRLKDETRTRVSNEHIKNLTIHSYHSFAKFAAGLHGFTDIMLNRAIKSSLRQDCKMDLLILDEQQDQTWLYFKLVSRIISEFVPERVLILGDSRQCIFSYKGADSRFLTCANEIFDLRSQKIHLSKSFRVTNQIAEFVNTVMLCRPPDCPENIQADKDGPPVTVCTCDIWAWNGFLEYMVTQINQYGFGNTFILSPSVKLTSRHIATLQEHLVAHKIPVYFPLFEDGLGKQDAMDGKVVFSSFHGSKGRERDLVFVLSFDNSYTKYYAKSGDPHACSNPVYVAMTRAKRKLVVIQAHDQVFPPYIDIDRMLSTCEMKLFIDGTTTMHSNEPKGSRKSATELVAHLNDITSAHLDILVKECFDAVKSKKLSLSIPTSSSQDAGEEEVSTITSLLINSEISKECSEESFIEGEIKKFRSDTRNRRYMGVPNKCLIMSHAKRKSDQSISSKVHKVLIYNAIMNRESFRLAQIKKYDWISESQLSTCVQNAKQNLNLTKGSEFEHVINMRHCCDRCLICCTTKRDFGIAMHIYGTLDVVTDLAVIENKATTEISLEHFLQLVVYRYLWTVFNPDINKKFILYNQLSGDMHELSATDKQIMEIMDVLIKSKSQEACQIPDKEFIQKASRIRHKHEKRQFLHEPIFPFEYNIILQASMTDH